MQNKILWHIQVTYFYKVTLFNIWHKHAFKSSSEYSVFPFNCFILQINLRQINIISSLTDMGIFLLWCLEVLPLWTGINVFLELLFLLLLNVFKHWNKNTQNYYFLCQTLPKNKTQNSECSPKRKKNINKMIK